MAIDYTQVNPGEVAADVMRQRALEAEEKAYIAEVEALRQEMVLKKTPAGEDHAVRESDLRNQRLEAEKQRRKAARANGAAPLTENDRANIHAGFLNKWIKAVEQQHAAHTAVRNEQSRLLELNGKAGLTEDEKVEAEEEQAAAMEAIKELEIAHEFAVELLDNLTARMDVPTSPEVIGAEAHTHAH